MQENEDKEYRVANFATFVSRTPIPPPLSKWMNLISKLAQYCINEIFDLSESYLGDFKMDVIKW